MTDPKSGFFRNRLMWAGFGLAAALEIINGLNYLYPSIPALTFKLLAVTSIQRVLVSSTG